MKNAYVIKINKQKWQMAKRSCQVYWISYTGPDEAWFLLKTSGHTPLACIILFIQLPPPQAEYWHGGVRRRQIIVVLPYHNLEPM